MPIKRNEFDHSRFEKYARREHIDTKELSLENYLSILPKIDRINIALLFEDLSPTFFRYGFENIIAVGSTTFPGDYWQDLNIYLKENDPSKLDIVKRRGEDIDLKICSATSYILLDDIIRRIETDLKNSKRDYLFSEEKRENGHHYWNTPKEHEEEFGKVTRYKTHQYGPSFEIKTDKGRDIHIFFEESWCGEEKFKQERIQNNPFSLLVINSVYSNFQEAVYELNSQKELDFSKTADCFNEEKKFNNIMQTHFSVIKKMKENREKPPQVHIEKGEAPF